MSWGVFKNTCIESLGIRMCKIRYPLILNLQTINPFQWRNYFRDQHAYYFSGLPNSTGKIFTQLVKLSTHNKGQGTLICVHNLVVRTSPIGFLFFPLQREEAFYLRVCSIAKLTSPRTLFDSPEDVFSNKLLHVLQRKSQRIPGWVSLVASLATRICNPLYFINPLYGVL